MSISPPPTADELPQYLDEDAWEWWAGFYLDNHLYSRGVVFEVFMQYPHEISRALIAPPVQKEREEFRPLLKAQRFAIARQKTARRIAARRATGGV